MSRAEKSMALNKDLELTERAEIARLRKVIEEKNRAIEGFKKYDDDRKRYYARFEENYKIMEERFNEFNNAVAECEELDYNSKRYLLTVVQGIKHRRINNDIEGGALNGVMTRLGKLDEHLAKLVYISSLIENKEVKEEMLKEINVTRTMRANIVSYIKRKLKSMI